MDLTGKTFGHLQVVGRDYNNKKIWNLLDVHI